MQAYLAEFIGTAILVLLGNGVVANVVLPRTKGNGGGWIVITFGWAMAVFVAVWCVGAISGAHLNPAVTVGLALAGKFGWELVPGYIAAQVLGGIVGAVLVYLFYRDHYVVSDDADAKLATFATGPAIRNLPRNMLCEVVGTFVLVFAVLMAAEPTITWPRLSDTRIASLEETQPREVDAAPASTNGKLGLGALGALPVGLLVLAIGLSLGGTTGYAINPARDFGPRIAHSLLPVPGKRDSDWSYAIVPIVGPLIGAALAAAVATALG